MSVWSTGAAKKRKLENSELRLDDKTRPFRPEILESYEPETELRRANARNFGMFSVKSPKACKCRFWKLRRNAFEFTAEFGVAWEHLGYRDFAAFLATTGRSLDVTDIECLGERNRTRLRTRLHSNSEISRQFRHLECAASAATRGEMV